MIAVLAAVNVEAKPVITRSSAGEYLAGAPPSVLGVSELHLPGLTTQFFHIPL